MRDDIATDQQRQTLQAELYEARRYLQLLACLRDNRYRSLARPLLRAVERDLGLQETYPASRVGSRLREEVT